MAMHNLFQKTLFPHATKIQSSEHLYKRYTGNPVDGPGPLRRAGVITFSPSMKPVACIVVDPAYRGTSIFCPNPLVSLSNKAADTARDAVKAVP